ncbi:MAG: PAS domain-containing protein [Henriciella sp.]|nr:PAS domain-containing protein [Henriciella sp.]
MISNTKHPNTKTILSAWQRITSATNTDGQGPRTSDHPDLIDRLFVIESSQDGAWLFRNAGDRIASLLGRELAEQNFLDFWKGHDREMLEGFLFSVQETRLPGILEARGETLTGQRVDIEMTLAPLNGLPTSGSPQRLLGLYQTLSPDEVLRGRPVWRHRLTAIYPPDIRPEPAAIKLVASND